MNLFELYGRLQTYLDRGMGSHDIVSVRSVKGKISTDNDIVALAERIENGESKIVIVVSDPKPSPENN
jgi:hypothetical protein